MNDDDYNDMNDLERAYWKIVGANFPSKVFIFCIGVLVGITVMIHG